MATENKVVKIYELRTVGYDDTLAKIQTLAKQWEAAAAAKKAYNNAGSSQGVEQQTARMKDLERQIQSLTASVERLRKANETAAGGGTSTSISAYTKLAQSYKQAEAAARDLAVQYGIESKEAQAAAKTAAQYRQELVLVNTAVKNGTTQSALLTQEQAKNAERTKQLNQETRQLAKDALAAGNSIEKLRAQLALATARRNRLEIDTAEFKEAEAEVLKLSTQLKELEARGGDFRRNVGNYSSGFDGIRNSINQLTREVPAFANSVQTGFLALSNNIPIFFDEIKRAQLQIAELRKQGEAVPSLLSRISQAFFSWGTLLSIGITLLTMYGKEIGNFVSSLFKGRQALDAFAEKQRLVNDSLKDSSLLQNITELKQLTLNIDLAKKGLLDKDEVLNQYNSTLGKVTGEVQNLNDAEQNLVKNGKKYIEFLVLRVAAQKAAEKSAQALIDAELASRKKPEEFLTTGDQIFAGTAAGAAATPGGGFIPGLSQQTQQTAASLRTALGAPRQAAEVSLKKSIEKLYFGIADDINNQINPILVTLRGDRKGKGDKETASKLDAAAQDELKRLDAIRNIQIAEENTRQNEIARIRKLSFDDQIQYARNIEKIEVTTLQSQIRFLESKKNLNAEELQTVSEFRERLTKIKLDTANKVNEIEEKRVRFEEQIIERQLAAARNTAGDRRDSVLTNPNATAAERGAANVNFDQEVLNAQLVALQQLEALNQQFTAEALERTRQAIAETRRILNEDQKRAQLADLEDIQNDADIKKAKITASYAVTRKAILDNEKLTADEKKKALDQLEKAEQRTLLSAEVDKLMQEVAVKEILLEKGIVSEKDYLAKLAELRVAAAELSAASGGNDKPGVSAQGFKTTRQLLQGGRSGNGGLRGLLGIDTENPKDQLLDQLLGQAIATSFDTAKAAMEGYFASEEQNIRNSLRVSQERLKIEEEQALNRAQTQQEEEALRRQFDAKKRAEEKKAGEDLKRVKVAEARISLATELANIAASAAGNPANSFTFGAAGAVMYGVLSAAALARYALNVANIQRTQFFEEGGQVPTKGGKFGGKPHSEGGTPFQFKGESFEAEVDELAVIRTKNAPKNRVYSLTGTQEQIASMLNRVGGGVEFAPGGRMTKFAMGGMLGESLQPPVWSPVSVFSASSSPYAKEQLEETRRLIQKFDEVSAAQSRRIDRIEVVQVTGTVTAAQKSEAIKKAVGTL
jgi:hypothetical protein